MSKLHEGEERPPVPAAAHEQDPVELHHEFGEAVAVEIPHRPHLRPPGDAHRVEGVLRSDHV